MTPSRSRRSGRFEWRAMRFLAFAMVPLGPWAALILAQLNQVPVNTARAWVLSPAQSIPLLTFALIGSLHASIGLRTIIDDYVHHPLAKRLGVWAVMVIPMTVLVIGLTTLFSLLEGAN